MSNGKAIKKCPECGVQVREDRLDVHLYKVHSMGLDPELTLEGEKSKVTIMIVAALIVAIIIAGFVLYPVLFDNPDDDNGNGGGDKVTHTIVTLETNFGNIEIEMFDDIAPITSKNFIDLVNEDRYNGVIFHRVIDSFMIQGGDFTNGDGTGGHAAEYYDGLGVPNDPNSWAIPDEFHPGARNVRGTLSMANSGPNTGGSQFFINLVANAHLNDKHAVFGKVRAGMDFVDNIANTPTGSNDKPVNDVIILNASVSGTIDVAVNWYE